MSCLFVQTLQFMLNTCFLSGASGILICVMQSIPMWPALNKNLGCRASNELLWAELSQTCCSIFAAGRRMCSVWPPTGEREREQEEAYTWIPTDSACLFPYDAALYPYYMTTIHLSHEYDYMRSPMSPSSEFSNVGWSWKFQHIPSNV